MLMITLLTIMITKEGSNYDKNIISRSEAQTMVVQLIYIMKGKMIMIIIKIDMRMIIVIIIKNDDNAKVKDEENYGKNNLDDN